MRMIGGKAVSGKVLTIVAELVMAVVALLLLWAFLTGSLPLISQAVQDMITSFKLLLCKSGILSWPGISSLCKSIVGV